MVSKIKPEIIILLLWFPERLINEDKRLWWWKQSRFPRLLRPLICNRLSKERNVLRSVAQDWHWVVGRMSGMPLTWNRGMEWGMCRTAWAEIHCWTVAKQRNEGRMQLTCPMSKCGRRSIKTWNSLSGITHRHKLMQGIHNQSNHLQAEPTHNRRQKTCR